VRVRHRPALATWGLVAVALVAVSFSAPITAATAAPALAVAFWRNAMGTAATVPVVAWRRRRAFLRGLPPDAWRYGGLAGVLLAVHFIAWLPSLRMTSITAATALVCTSPMWTVAFDLVRRVPVPRGVIGGTALALAGVVAITGVDAATSWRAAAGDALALVGAISVAGYMAAGERVRRATSTGEYTVLAYGVCALVVLPVCLLSGTPLGGWSSRTWIELVVLTASAQLLGHTLLNAALPRLGATPVALAVLLEVPGAALVGWAWLGLTPPVAVLPGTVLMLMGLAVVVRSRPATRQQGVVEVT
jgi:drug/metabolite transporter (DMT)-like permease